MHKINHTVDTIRDTTVIPITLPKISTNSEIKKLKIPKDTNLFITIVSTIKFKQ